MKMVSPSRHRGTEGRQVDTARQLSSPGCKQGTGSKSQACQTDLVEEGIGQKGAMSGTQKALTPATIPPFIRDHAVELVEKLLGRAQAKFESYDAMLESYHAGRVVQLPRGPLPLMGKRDEALLDAQAFRSILELLEDARPEHEKATIAAFEALSMTRSGARVIA